MYKSPLHIRKTKAIHLCTLKLHHLKAKGNMILSFPYLTTFSVFSTEHSRLAWLITLWMVKILAATFHFKDMASNLVHN